MVEDPYIFLSFVSGIVVTTLGIVLCLVRIESDGNSRKIRIARLILAASYFLLSVPDWLNMSGANDVGDKTAATIVSASIQSLLFTFTLIAMIQPGFLTRKVLTVNIGIVGVCSALFLAADSLWGGPAVICAAVAAVAVQLLLYTRVFRKCYRKFVQQIQDHYDEEYERHLHWARNGFYAALAVGVSAILSLAFPDSAYNIFMCCYMAFYLWFAGRFINYVVGLNYYLPAVRESAGGFAAPEPDAEPETVAADFAGAEDLKERLKAALDEYVSAKDYLDPDKDRNYIMERGGVDQRFFRWYFQNVLGQDFRVWRAGLRIEEAKRVIQTTPDVSMNALAIKLGFGTSQNFYHHFKKIVGQTPTEFLDGSGARCI